MGSTELFGDLECAVKARHAGGAGGSTDLSGSTLAVTRAGTGRGTPGEDAWWANVSLRRATLKSAGGVRFDGQVHVSAKDASPVTAVVSQNTAVPTWAADIFRMPALDADAELRVAPSSLEVRSLVARGGGGASVRAEYTKRAGVQDGAVLLDLGWMDLGYDLAQGSIGLVLLGPQAWYARKTAVVRDAAVAASRKTEVAEQLALYVAMTPELRRQAGHTLAARCALDVRSCDGASIDSLLQASADAVERRTLGGIAFAPMLVAAAKGGADGTTLDPRVVGSVTETLSTGGLGTLDDIPSVTFVAASNDPDAARGKVVAVAGRITWIRRERTYSVGTLTTGAALVYFVTPFMRPTPSRTPPRASAARVQHSATRRRATRRAPPRSSSRARSHASADDSPARAERPGAVLVVGSPDGLAR